MSDETVTRQLRMHGRVQGVYYRASMVAEATRLGLHGWVRNRADGCRVEAVVAGEEPAVQALLNRTGLALGDFDVIESNEAFAAQACAVTKDLGLDPAKVNPNGSGISLGHPVGATGAIIATKAIHELQRIQGRYALATMCIGVGQGIAMVLERV